MPTRYCQNSLHVLRPCSLMPIAELVSDGEEDFSYLFICEIEERYTGTPVTLLMHISKTPKEELLSPIIAFEMSSKPDESTSAMKVCFRAVNNLKEKEYAPLAAFVLSQRKAITEAISKQSTVDLWVNVSERRRRGIGYLQTMYERWRLGGEKVRCY